MGEAHELVVAEGTVGKYLVALVLAFGPADLGGQLESGGLGVGVHLAKQLRNRLLLGLKKIPV